MKELLISCLITLQILAFIGCEKTTPEIQPSYTQYGTPFEEMPQTSDIVLYEVNLRAFSTSGTIQGVINRLDELESLGINVIWLMPIHPIGQVNSVNSPYSVQNYKAISSEYGSLSDLRHLTTEAHNRGMAVIIDWIANHTAWDNEWIENKSWYTQNVNGDIVHPAGTNWLDVADLNFSNPDMRLAMIDAMKYWVLEANIDGFRCDHADGVPSTFWKQAIDTLRNLPNRKIIMLAEGARTNHYSAGFDLLYAWNFYYKLKDIFNGETATSLYTTHVSEYATVPQGKHRMRYTTNHDESAWEDTPITFFNGKNGALAASVTAIFMDGVPLFYTGQEVGRASKLPF
ncbi:MAG: alpha-amylase, partial [Bacteroidales bacterium]|nr:alpha-amylase [Bacteroidales bacterium]